jgi:hypothetical protein
MKGCAWMLLSTLLASPVWPQEPAPPSDTASAESAPDKETRGKTPDSKTVVLDAEKSRLLRQFIAQREQTAAPPDADAKPDADRANLSPTAISGELERIPVQRARRPYAIGCDDFDCYTIDRNGNPIEKVPRDKYLGKFGNDPADLLACQSDNNMLSTFERDAQCRGLGNGLVNPYRPVVTPADLDH